VASHAVAQHNFTTPKTTTKTTRNGVTWLQLHYVKAQYETASRGYSCIPKKNKKKNKLNVPDRNPAAGAAADAVVAKRSEDGGSDDESQEREVDCIEQQKETQKVDEQCSASDVEPEQILVLVAW
jgi:hypothetical protein